MGFQRSMQNPGKMFGAPEVLESSTAFDASHKRASGESMLGPESNGAGADCLRRVVDALIRLA